jgi:hypothetical protein
MTTNLERDRLFLSVGRGFPGVSLAHDPVFILRMQMAATQKKKPDASGSQEGAGLSISNQGTNKACRYAGKQRRTGLEPNVHRQMTRHPEPKWGAPAPLGIVIGAGAVRAHQGVMQGRARFDSCN